MQQYAIEKIFHYLSNASPYHFITFQMLAHIISWSESKVIPDLLRSDQNQLGQFQYYTVMVSHFCYNKISIISDSKSDDSFLFNKTIVQSSIDTVCRVGLTRIVCRYNAHDLSVEHFLTCSLSVLSLPEMLPCLLLLTPQWMKFSCCLYELLTELYFVHYQIGGPLHITYLSASKKSANLLLQAGVTQILRMCKLCTHIYTDTQEITFVRG